MTYDSDDTSVPATKTYEDGSGQMIVTNEGYTRIAYVYDGLDRVMEEYYQDAEGSPITTVKGYQAKRYTRDLMDRVISEACYMADLQTKVDSTDGYCEIAYAYDKNSNVVKITYYGANGWGAADENGVNRIEREYDERGNLLWEKKYDLGMKLIE